MNIIDRMRADWNRRAKEDAHYFVAFGRQQQSEEEFLASAAEIVPIFEQEFGRLPPGSAGRRALEIGCGPGRLLLPMSRYFDEIHGVDISDEMVAMARQRLRDVPNARVHVTSGAGLSMLEDGYFDFVYSYAVFQHIPSRDVVLSYLREAQRVLKPGGILNCQLGGKPHLDFELRNNPETWTGCYFGADDIAAFARENKFPLVAISGIDTKYMWTTFRKQTPVAAERDAAHTVLKAVTAAANGGMRVPARGPEAAVSLWIDGFPENGDLAHFPVWFDRQPQLGCYLSPVGDTGGCQLNCRLPSGLVPGPAAVRLSPGGEPHPIKIVPPPPLNPTVVSVTDGINLTSHFRIETGSAKVFIKELECPEEVSFRIAGQPVTGVVFNCTDPITFTCEFSFKLPDEARTGIHALAINVAGRELEPVSLKIV